MSTRSRQVYWTPEDDPGCEQLALRLAPDGIEGLGLVLRMLDGQHLRCRYVLRADPDWSFRHLTIAVTEGADGATRRLQVNCEADGAWAVDGETAPDLVGCREIDIQVTPFTNSLPIRRLGLKTGESREIRVAYVPVPALTVRPVEQRYTCLEPVGERGGRYRYEGRFRDFEAELPVDPDGLVIDYPETFRRQWPR